MAKVGEVKFVKFVSTWYGKKMVQTLLEMAYQIGEAGFMLSVTMRAQTSAISRISCTGRIFLMKYVQIQTV